MKTQIEKIGFTDYHVYKTTLEKCLRKFRDRLNKLVSIYVDTENIAEIKVSSRKKIQKKVNNLLKDIHLLREELEFYSQATTSNSELNKVHRSELQRSKELIIIAKKIIEKLD